MAGTSYQAYTTGSFTVGAGSHTITFVGLDTAGGDNTAFIDAVGIHATSLAALATPTWTVYDGADPYADFDGSGTPTEPVIIESGRVAGSPASPTTTTEAARTKCRLGSFAKAR